MAREKPKDTLTPDERCLVDHAIAVLRHLICLYGYEIHFGSFRPDPPSKAIDQLLRGASLPELRGALVQVLVALHPAEKAQGES